MSILDTITNNQKIKDNIQLITILLISLWAFSIPFGHEYGSKLRVFILLLWIIVVNKKDIIKIITHKVMLTLIALILMHYVSLFWSSNIDMGMYLTRKILVYVYFPILIFVTIIKKNQFKLILAFFIVGMFINEIISYLIYFDLYQTEHSIKHSAYPVGFINHITYSTLVSFTALLILYEIKLLNSVSAKVLYSLFFLTMTINLMISGGRTGYLVFFISLFLLPFTYCKIAFRNIFLITFSLITIFFIGYKMNSMVHNRINSAVNNLEQIFKYNNFDTSVGARLAFYFITKDIVSQKHNNYLLGVGVGDIEEEMKSSIKRTKVITKDFAHTHSSYLETYLNTGVIGLILLIFLLYFIWQIKIKNKEILFIQQLLVISLCVSMFFARILEHHAATMLFFSIFVSIFLAQEKIENEN